MLVNKALPPYLYFVSKPNTNADLSGVLSDKTEFCYPQIHNSVLILSYLYYNTPLVQKSVQF